MKKLIVVAILVMVCLTGCSLKGFNVKVDEATTDMVKPAEAAK
jgi:hypothetical protein